MMMEGNEDVYGEREREVLHCWLDCCCCCYFLVEFRVYTRGTWYNRVCKDCILYVTCFYSG